MVLDSVEAERQGAFGQAFCGFCYSGKVEEMKLRPRRHFGMKRSTNARTTLTFDIWGEL
jgi:hypothetical protein